MLNKESECQLHFIHPNIKVCHLSYSFILLILHFFSEVILTLGSSKTVLEFLCAAKEKKRSFRVFVAEGAPRLVVEAS